MYRKIVNFFYIFKLLFKKDWWIWQQAHVNYYQKVTFLTTGQVEGVLYWIFVLRKKKFYRLADYLRKKLVDIGCHWFDEDGCKCGCDPISKDEKLRKRAREHVGHYRSIKQDGLLYKASKDRIYLEGFIHPQPFKEYEFVYTFKTNI